MLMTNSTRAFFSLRGGRQGNEELGNEDVAFCNALNCVFNKVQLWLKGLRAFFFQQKFTSVDKGMRMRACDYIYIYYKLLGNL